MKYEIEFEHRGSFARTLSPSYFSDERRVGNFTKIHENGWTLTGTIKEDYYYWVNEFEVNHPKLGTVSGNFEKKVIATSKKTYDEFLKLFPYEEWDYLDI